MGHYCYFVRTHTHTNNPTQLIRMENGFGHSHTGNIQFFIGRFIDKFKKIRLKCSAVSNCTIYVNITSYSILAIRRLTVLSLYSKLFGVSIHWCCHQAILPTHGALMYVYVWFFQIRIYVNSSYGGKKNENRKRDQDLRLFIFSSLATFGMESMCKCIWYGWMAYILNMNTRSIDNLIYEN